MTKPYHLLLALLFGISAAASAPSLLPVLSMKVSISVTAPATTIFQAVAGHRYLVRLAGASGPVGLSIYEDGNGAPIAASTGSNLKDEPAILVSVSKNGALILKAAALDGKESGATIEAFDATALTAPLLYVEQSEELKATRTSADGISVVVHRIGDLGKAASYPLRVEIAGGVRKSPVHFGAGEDIATAFLSFPPSASPIGEREERVRLDPAGLSQETIANDALLGLPQEVRISVIDAPPRPKTLTFPRASARNASGSARSGHLDFDISLSSPAATPVSLSYVTNDGQAVGGRDYVGVSGVLVFAPGETGKRISVPLLRPDVIAGEKTFQLNLLSPFGLTFTSGKTVESLTGTIRAD